MYQENQFTDKKSLQVLEKGKSGYERLAQDCVCFANSGGGRLLIGIEDKSEGPPPEQHIPLELLNRCQRNLINKFVNVSIVPTIKVAENGGEYIEIYVQPSQSSVAATVNGKYYMRSGEECRAVMPDDLLRLMTDRSAFVWETQTYLNIPIAGADVNQIAWFKKAVSQSGRISAFIKEMDEVNLLRHFNFSRDEKLTNLGILWLGKAADRGRLLYSPTVQYIKYNELEEKINKLVWSDFSLNPAQLVESIWREIPDWKESDEIIEGLFAEQVPHYDETVVRELIINALIHRPYTISGDIFIKIYPDRLIISNPGQLPLGVTPNNVLHRSIQRNRMLANVCYYLELMEKEGSGYDRMYERQLLKGKRVPKMHANDHAVTVTVQKRVTDKSIIGFMNRVSQAFQLTLKEVIALGVIAQNGPVTVIELTRLLQLEQGEVTKKWIGRLVEFNLIEKQGKTKGTTYQTTDAILRSMEFTGRTTLSRIKPHRLRQLIMEDLQIYRSARIEEIHNRIGLEIKRRSIKSQIDNLVRDGRVAKLGKTRHTVYSINED